MSFCDSFTRKIYFTPWDFFKSALADWVSLETSLLKFPRLFSVFWSISTMLYFGFSPLVLSFPSPLGPFTEHSVTGPRAAAIIDMTIFFKVAPYFFKFLARSSYLSFFSVSFNFSLRSTETTKSIAFFFGVGVIIMRSSYLAEITWSISIFKFQEFGNPILQEIFWVVHIPFVHMVKFQYLAQYLVDHLYQTVMSILFLC